MAPVRRSIGRNIALLGLVCALASGCGAFGAAAPDRVPGGVEGGTESSGPDAIPAGIAAIPADGAVEVNPASPASLTVSNGSIERAALTSATGDKVPGVLTADRTTWTTAGTLKFDSRYTYTYTVVDAAGRKTEGTRTFRTVTAANEADAAIYPLDGMKVGVAQPLQVVFSEPVLNRDIVEQALTITSTSGQTGDFHWFSDRMVRYRPETFWAANSTITMDMKMFGVELGNGQIGNFNKTVTIHIGDKRVAIADAAAHTFSVSINDVPSGTWPVTMGDERFPSARGFLVLMEKRRYDHFVAASIGLAPGDPAYYGEVDVEYAIRLTPSGAYIHQALDSAMPYLGNANVSHGCIGMPPAGAAWVFNNMTTGDVVEVINTEGDYAYFDDGFGDWNIPWSEYAN